jgi:phage/plasmid-associated DNA primase
MFSVKAVDMWEAYKAWAEANDVKARTKRELAQELEGAGVRVLKNSNMVYSGVCLV